MLRRSRKTIAVPVVTARRAAAFRRRLIVLGAKAGIGVVALGAAFVAKRKLSGGTPPQDGPHVTPAASAVPPVKSVQSEPVEPAAKPETPEAPVASGMPLDAEEKESVDEALASSFEKGDEPGYP